MPIKEFELPQRRYGRIWITIDEYHCTLCQIDRRNMQFDRWIVDLSGQRRIWIPILYRDRISHEIDCSKRKIIGDENVCFPTATVSLCMFIYIKLL